MENINFDGNVIKEFIDGINEQKILINKYCEVNDKLEKLINSIGTDVFINNQPQLSVIEESLQKEFNTNYTITSNFAYMTILHKKQKEVIVRIPIEYYNDVWKMQRWWYANNKGVHHVYCAPAKYKSGRYEYSLLDYIYGCGGHIPIIRSNVYEIFSATQLDHVTNCVQDLLNKKSYITLNTIESRVMPEVLEDEEGYAIFIDFTKLSVRKKGVR